MREYSDAVNGDERSFADKRLLISVSDTCISQNNDDRFMVALGGSERKRRNHRFHGLPYF